MDKFRWNPYADQPHNIASRGERLRHHFRYTGSYLQLFFDNVSEAGKILSLYRKYKKKIYRESCDFHGMFGMAVSPHDEKNPEIISLLKQTGIRHTLVRMPSWEIEKLGQYHEFLESLQGEGFEIVLALLQRREDLKSLSRWKHFLEVVFKQCRDVCSCFEIGHAWNRTKWGIWDFKEYLQLARPAAELADKYGLKTAGPAIIDFEFHLYPSVLKRISFDKISSLLYVDRVGPPENKQYGWDTSSKVALLKAVIDAVTSGKQGLWITEFNWPITGTGKYSPAAGRPNVSEQMQADYLVRYYILCLASGLIERVFWWQLIAPGYGLVDSRGKVWRKRPGFEAYQTMVSQLEGATFIKQVRHSDMKIFLFQKSYEDLAVCWTSGPVLKCRRERSIRRIINRDGLILQGKEDIEITQSPVYIHSIKRTGVSGIEQSEDVIMYFQKHEVIRYEKKRYSGLDQKIVHSREEKIIRKIFRKLNVYGGRALDIPCGYGRFSILLLNQGIKLVNGDISFHMVKRARERLVPDKLYPSNAVVADAVRGLPFISGSFDLIFSMRFFHHIHNQQDRMIVLKEFSRVTSRWIFLSYYQSNILHHFQRRIRRIVKKSPTRIKMISRKMFCDSAEEAGFRVVKKFPLFRGLHSQHIVLLEKL